MSDVAGTNGQHNGQHEDLTPSWRAQAACSRSSFATADARLASWGGGEQPGPRSEQDAAL